MTYTQWIIFIICCGVLPIVGLAQASPASYFNKLEQTTDLKMQAELYGELGELYSYIQLDSAVLFSELAMKTAEESQDSSTIGKILIRRASLLRRLETGNAAIPLIERAIAIFETLPKSDAHRIELLEAQRLLANLKERNDESLSINFELLKVVTEQGDLKKMAITNSRIANIVYEQGLLKETIAYETTAIKQLEQTGELFMLVEKLSDAANTRIGMKDFEQSDSLSQRALQLIEGKYCPVLRARVLLIYAFNLMVEEETNGQRVSERVEQLYQEAYYWADKANDTFNKIFILNDLGYYYEGKEQFKTSILYYQRALKAAQSLDHLRFTWDVRLSLAQNYAYLQEHDSAYFHQNIVLHQKDSFNQAAYNKEIANLQAQYETATKEATINLQQAQISRQQLILLFTIGVLVFLGIVGIVLYRLTQQLKKKNAQNEILLKEIHHRVKNNLQTISGLLELQSTHIDDESTLAAIEASQTRVHSIALIHQKLYQGENLAMVNMKDYLENLGETIIDIFDIDTTQIDINYLVAPIEIDIDRAIPLGLIANELLTNTLKYAFPNDRKGKVNIRFETTKTREYYFEVSDNGIGVTDILPHQATRDGGFGTQLIGILVQQLEGRIDTQKEHGFKTTIRFQIENK